MCAVAPDGMAILIIGRLFLGVAGVSTPIMYAILRSHARDEGEVHRDSGILVGAGAGAGAGGVGVAVGYLIAGFVVRWNVTSRTMFWITAALALVTFAVSYFGVPDIRTRIRVPLDVVGMLLLAAGMVGIVLYVGNGSALGWTGTKGLVSVIGGGVLLVLFCLREMWTSNPMVDLRVIANRRVLPAMVSSAVPGTITIYFSLTMSTYIRTPKMVGYGLGGTVLTTAVCLSFVAVALILSGAITKRLVAIIGLRWATVPGVAIVGANALWLGWNHRQARGYIVGTLRRWPGVVGEAGVNTPGYSAASSLGGGIALRERVIHGEHPRQTFGSDVGIVPPAGFYTDGTRVDQPFSWGRLSVEVVFSHRGTEPASRW